MQRSAATQPGGVITKGASPMALPSLVPSPTSALHFVTVEKIFPRPCWKRKRWAGNETTNFRNPGMGAGQTNDEI